MLRLVAVSSEPTFLALQRLYPGARFERHCTAPTIERCLRSTPINGVIVVGDWPDLDEQCLVGLAAFSRMPLVFYGALQSVSSSVLGAITRAANPRIFLKLHDPEKRAIEFLWSQSPAREQLAFRDALSEPLAQLPLRVREALEYELALLPTGSPVVSAAARAELSPHRLLELVKSVGVRGTHRLFRTRNMINAWGFGQDDAYGEQELARVSGFETLGGLTRGLLFMGVRSRSEFCLLTPEELISTALGKVLVR